MCYLYRDDVRMHVLGTVADKCTLLGIAEVSAPPYSSSNLICLPY